MAHVSTIAYALVNRSDPWLALCFAGNALCCVVILAIAWWKGRDRASCAPGLDSIHHLEMLELRPRGTRGGRQVRDEYRDFSRAVLVQ